jgi:NADH-quinone oxidoreductase subunit N
VDDLDGLSSTNPVAAFAIAVFTLSLAGIPPLPGFWGKLTLALSALEVDGTLPITWGSRRAWFVALAVLLAVNAAIAAAYYLRLIAAMYFKSTKRGVQADGGLAGGLAMLACLVLVGFVTIQPRGLLAAATRAGKSLTSPVPAATAATADVAASSPHP